MTRDWQELTRMTGGRSITIERVRLVGEDMAIEGSFDLPPLARLSAEDQVFITAFIRGGGSIKEMEKLFGISYPTVKNRLKKLSAQLEFVEIDPPPSRTEILEKLDRGEISAEEAVSLMNE